ncbi:hypothetical protein Aph01nite_44100 [Acrocarpospora phusangensis]|uniref:Uncharacterized protein n=1 Tax=Acrocarpospora phusangensis TaxID=1070424 RepID=A0A919QEV5_9ACTN|nr:hypothetical protein Aph01nite_44100 [Acrocarpospora phusangensis]
MPVLAGGTGTAVRLLCATLAAIGAYVGGGTAHVAPAGPVHTITLSADPVPAYTACDRGFRC